MLVKKLQTPCKTANRKKTLLHLILSLLSPRQVRKLRARYSLGIETIAELSQISACPPVLLYSVLTSLCVKTALKLRLLRVEKQVILLRNEGFTQLQIARKLQIPGTVVLEHTDECFIPEAYLARPWYHDRAPKPKDPNELAYEEETLPPTSRLGWIDGALTDIPAHRKGRCPICGHLVSLPCLACRLRDDMSVRFIPKAGEFNPAEEEDVFEPDLLFV